MLKFFDVGNKARIGFWCIAKDAETAIQIAFEANHAKKKENLRATDITEEFLQSEKGPEVAEMANGNIQGHLIKQGFSLSLTDLMAGKKPPPAFWKIVGKKYEVNE